MKQSMSISHGAAAGHRHNVEIEYREGLEHVDESRTQYNVVLVDRDLGELYDELFGDAVREYNAHQKRDDRKIDNYLEKIKSSKQEKPVYEMVVQIGNKDTNSARSSANRLGSSLVYQNFLEKMEKEFPNLKIQQAVIHSDEATPHMHVAYVPVSTENKRGLKTKNSLRGAYREMGYNDIREANNSLFKILSKTAGELGIERLDVGCNRAHMTVRDFKEMADTIEREGKGKYNNDPALVNLLLSQQKQIDEMAKINEEAIACINEIARAAGGEIRFGNYRETVREIAQRAKEECEALNPHYDRVRSAVRTFREKINELPEWWRDNIINPVSERLRTAREHYPEWKERQDAKAMNAPLPRVHEKGAEAIKSSRLYEQVRHPQNTVYRNVKEQKPEQVDVPTKRPCVREKGAEAISASKAFNQQRSSGSRGGRAR